MCFCATASEEPLCGVSIYTLVAAGRFMGFEHGIDRPHMNTPTTVDFISLLDATPPQYQRFG